MFPAQFVLTSMLVAAGLAARINVRQDSESTAAAGVSISVGLAANRSAPAAEVFGTTTDDVNFLTLPTTLCVVPMYATEAGIKFDSDTSRPLITQQALEICPQAKTISVHSNSTTTANSTTSA